LLDIYKNYNEYAWEWCAALISSQLGTDPVNMPVAGLIQIIAEWKTNAVKFNNMILKDAEKEFDTTSRLGFGIDGDENTRDLDFEVVRGAFRDNKFVSGLEKEINSIEEKADRLISFLEKFQYTS
jgi:hypothetical protein